MIDQILAHVPEQAPEFVMRKNTIKVIR